MTRTRGAGSDPVDTTAPRTTTIEGDDLTGDLHTASRTGLELRKRTEMVDGAHPPTDPASAAGAPSSFAATRARNWAASAGNGSCSSTSSKKPSTMKRPRSEAPTRSAPPVAARREEPAPKSALAAALEKLKGKT